MGIREQNLETIAPMLAAFKISQTGGIDDLKDADIGKAVMLNANYTVGPCLSGSQLLGKLVALTLTDADTGKRTATIQIGGICRLPISSAYPTIGNRLIGGTSGTVRQASVLTGYDPVGGNIARGTVLAVNGTADCIALLN
jgi:hypothetical protein